MTVSNTNNKGGPYSGNGSTTAFSTVFEFDSEDDLQVILTSSAGVETVQTKTTHYTVSGGSGSAGTVTMVTAPASGEKLTIVSNISLTQSADYTEGGPFPAETHEGALDKLTRIAKQQQEEIDRGLKVAASSTISGDIDTSGASAGTAIVLNSAGTGFEFSSSNVEDLADDAAAAATSAAAAAASATSASASAASAAADAASIGALANSEMGGIRAPNADNDGADTDTYGIAFSVGSIWVDLTNDVSYRCVDNSTGAAVWNQESIGDKIEDFNEVHSFVLSEPENDTYLWWKDSVVAETLTELYGECDAGDFTANLKVAGSTVATVAVTSGGTATDTTFSANIAAGDDVTLEITGVSGCTNAFVRLESKIDQPIG